MNPEITAAVLTAAGEVERFPTVTVVGAALACFAVLAVGTVLLYRGVRLMRRVRAAAARGVAVLPAAYRPRYHTPEVPLAKVEAKGRGYAVGGAVLLVLGAVMWAQHQQKYRELGITTPSTVAGLPRFHDAKLDGAIARSVAMLERDPTVDRAMAAFYGSRERPVFVAAAALSGEPDDATASGYPGEFLVQLRRTYQIAGRSEPYPPGARGGHMSCMRASPGVPAGVCVWIDDWTLGYVQAPADSLAELAELTRDIRADVER